ncbi:hypothetical protein D0T60_02730 [Bacteroides sp. 224]|nr:hypothetical protein [Bacteroides sp. 224]
MTTVVLLSAACKDDDDKGVNSVDFTPLSVGTLTVVTAVKDDVAAEKDTEFFLPGDIIEFQYNQKGASLTSFSAEMEDDETWSDLSTELYRRDIYVDGVTPETFVALCGNQSLVADQSTKASFHAAHYLKGDASLGTYSTKIAVDSMVNQHVKVIVKILKSESWAGDDFTSVVGDGAVTIFASDGTEVKPLYDGTQTNRSVYSAVLPINKVPGAGMAAFSLNSFTSLDYKIVAGSEAPRAGETLLITVRYEKDVEPEATAVVKTIWDTPAGLDYGYSPITEIYTIEDLDLFAASVSSGLDYEGETVVLKNSLDLKNEAINPIGNKNNPFNGTFLGKGNVVYNFAINSNQEHAGFFASVGVHGTVQELKFANATIKNLNSYTAVVAGSNYGYIIACSTTDCEVAGSNYSASIVGYNENTIVGCEVIGDKISTTKPTDAIAGGIAGYNYKKIIACKSLPKTVEVTRTSVNRFGAVVGECSLSATVDRCLWKEEGLPAFYTWVEISANNYGYQEQSLNKSSIAEMNQAISEYNTGRDRNSNRYCSLIWVE